MRERLMSAYRECRLCPRECAVNRLEGERGFCGETSELRVAVAGLHFGEEPPLTGSGGSGTIFITGCAMGCPFCQNHQISRSGAGRIVDEAGFVAIARALELAGAENLNLVTPSHMAPTLAVYLDAAREAGVDLPVAWNSSGFEDSRTIGMVSPWVDIWLPDFKTLDPEASECLYGVDSYPRTAAAAILEMAGLGAVETDSAGRMIRGVLLRHLVLPGDLESTRRVLEWFASELSGRAWLSLMTQYTPVRIPGERRAIPGRQLDGAEYETVLDWLEDYGIDDGFVQELVPGDDWLPDFDRTNPFSSELSRIIWHCNTGFVDAV